MAFTASLDRTTRVPGLRDWVARTIAERRAARARFREYFRLYGELARLSDRDLADIGIARDEIDDIARDHAFGRPGQARRG